MSLVPIFKTGIKESDRFGQHLIHGWRALDEESGAFLTRTYGHGKGGLPTYILVLPNKTPEERGGLLAPYEWDYPTGRKFIRAWSDQEAIEIANQRLAKMLAKRARND